MKIEIELPCSEEELSQALAAAEQANPGPLRGLCQKEVARFESMMRQHPDYSDGLVRIEKFAVEGYLYQKLRGHIDAKAETGNLPEER